MGFWSWWPGSRRAARSPPGGDAAKDPSTREIKFFDRLTTKYGLASGACCRQARAPTHFCWGPGTPRWWVRAHSVQGCRSLCAPPPAAATAAAPGAGNCNPYPVLTAKSLCIAPAPALACSPDSPVSAGWASLRGKRSTNEDTVFCEFRTHKENGSDAGQPGTSVGCFGVFDGCVQGTGVLSRGWRAHGRIVQPASFVLMQLLLAGQLQPPPYQAAVHTALTRRACLRPCSAMQPRRPVRCTVCVRQPVHQLDQKRAVRFQPSQGSGGCVHRNGWAVH